MWFTLNITQALLFRGRTVGSMLVDVLQFHGKSLGPMELKPGSGIFAGLLLCFPMLSDYLVKRRAVPQSF